MLAIVAARLGFAPVTAVEVDRGALEMITGNAAANRVAVTVEAGDVASAPPWAPTVIANLTRPLLVAAAQRIERPPERLLASGFLAREADEVVAAWGLREQRRLDEGEWAAVELVALIRLAVRVAREHAEPVLAELLVLSPGGLEERDVDDDTVEYALYGAPGELPDVGEMRAAAAGALVDVSTSELADGWESAGATGTGRSTSARCACGRRGSRPARARSTW